jgi:hypothetical protein
VLFDEFEYFVGEVPSCVVDDYAEFFAMFVESFDECEKFFPVDFLTEFCCDFSDA